ncbi:MAG: UbiA-like polyprenyltransferase [Chitinophagaceae bacterium]
MTTIKNYLSLVKFSHTIFAMPFAIIGFFLGLKKSDDAFTTNSFKHELVSGLNPFYSIGIPLVLVIVCMVTARSAAMAFNRYLDRHFDAKNPRTAIREIPSGIISANNALRFVIINCCIFILACFFINTLCLWLSPVALFVILFYSYTKRFTALCHLVLGVGLSLAPIGAYLAVTGCFALLPILFSLAVVFWVSGFDIIFALQDVDFDQSQQLYSIPAVLGKSRALRVSELLHLVSAVCILIAGFIGDFHIVYWLGVTVFIGMLIYQHAIVKPNDLSKVNIAFMTANGIASVLFAVFVIADMFFN